MVQRSERPEGQPSPPGTAGGKAELSRKGEGGSVARRRAFSPFFGMSPSEFFSASPFELMRRLLDENRVWSGAGETAERTWTPPLEVLERDGKLIIRAELPGVKEDDVHVELTDEGIVIQGERRLEDEERGDGFYRSERSYGQFYRLIPLPEGAEAEQAAAEFKNGMLEVSVPVQKKSTRQRQIPIRSSGSVGAKPIAPGGSSASTPSGQRMSGTSGSSPSGSGPGPQGSSGSQGSSNPRDRSSGA
jgi:HSP20 family protein